MDFVKVDKETVKCYIDIKFKIKFCECYTEILCKVCGVGFLTLKRITKEIKRSSWSRYIES